MVEIKNYCKSIKSRPILNNVSYNFEYGKIYGIYGHNGSNKTMQINAIKLLRQRFKISTVFE